MFISEKIIDEAWTQIPEVATGDEFRVQNISHNTIRYCVFDSTPPANIAGGALPKDAQLAFKKVAGDLYLKSTGSDGINRITKVHIERVE